MKKRCIPKPILAILFIASAFLIEFMLKIFLTRSGNGEWTKVVDVIWFLTFWLILWRLSSDGYENRRNVARWISASGLSRAFLIFLLSLVLTIIGQAVYCQIALRTHFELFQLSEAIGSFYIDNNQYPAASGPITSEMIDELRGSPTARINSARTDYLKQTESYDPFLHTWPGTANYYQDTWGHPFYLRLIPPNPKPGDHVNATIISCGPNGKYEDGGGDDITFECPGP